MSTLLDSFYQNLTPSNKTALEEILRALPKSAKPYLVGGCVRDIVMKTIPKDYDIEVHDVSPTDFEKSMAKLRADGVGKAFFVYKYRYFDISLPRNESKSGIGHRAFEVSIETDLKKACSRRDFTINAMMIDLRGFELIDFFDGTGDIKRKIIRFVDRSTFADDSLRAIRAVQFSARFGFKIEPMTLHASATLDISDLPKERIYAELYKLFLAKKLHFGLYYLYKIGLLSKIFGLQITKSQLLSLMLELQRAVRGFANRHELLLLFIISTLLKVSIVQLLSNLSPPSAMFREARAQKRVPKVITSRFLLGVACTMPIKEWLGSYKSGVKKRSDALGIWDKHFKPKVSSQDALTLGLKNDEIGKYLRAKRSEEIREYKK